MRIEFSVPASSATSRAFTLVVQSHRQPLPFAILRSCLDSVQAWAQLNGYSYQFVGDELFDLLPSSLWPRLGDRLVVASDVARLLLLQEALAAGFHRVIWFDADIYVLDEAALQLPSSGFVVGRETWVQPQDGRPRLYKKVHNAVLQTSRQDPVLPFYLDSAMRLLHVNTDSTSNRFVGPDQFVGPKSLTAWHNIAPFSVAEQVNMLPPAVALDLLAGGGEYLQRYCGGLDTPPAALTLCASELANACADPLARITEIQLEAVLAMLKTDADMLIPSTTRA